MTATLMFSLNDFNHPSQDDQKHSQMLLMIM